MIRHAILRLFHAPATWWAHHHHHFEHNPPVDDTSIYYGIASLAVGQLLKGTP